MITGKLLTLFMALFWIWPQAPATGAKTDVLATSMGELQITPTPPNAIVLEWAALQIYVNPPPSGQSNPRQARPKADLVILTRAGASVPADLHKASTQVVSEGSISPGTKRTIQLPGTGLAQNVEVTAVGRGLVLELGKRLLYITGYHVCDPAAKQVGRINVAFVAIDPALGQNMEKTEACVQTLNPQVVYPYYAPDDLAPQFAAGMKKSGIRVRVRSW